MGTGDGLIVGEASTPVTECILIAALCNCCSYDAQDFDIITFNYSMPYCVVSYVWPYYSLFLHFFQN